MLAVDCDRTGGRVLVFSGDIHEIDNTAGGMVVRYRCACGQPGVMVTGRRSAAHRTGHAVTMP